ncbi:MAG: efflux RND transporter periplasmic adaptor subunit [Nitrospiraceae bacterium]|nr:efflux RND transporter periplasmic adaptor subunit [Nitrospiraceae bacterium]
MKKKKVFSIVTLLVAVLAGAFFLFGGGELIKKGGFLGKPQAKTEQKKTQSMPGMPGMEQPASQASNAPSNTSGADGGWGDETAGAPAVEIPRDKQQMIGVKTAVAQVMPLEKDIRTVGRVSYDEKRLATVNTKVAGWIERLYVDYTGMYVRKGQPLAEIYSPELFSTEQEYLNVLRWAKMPSKDKGTDGLGIDSMLSGDARQMLQAARQRLRLYDIPESEIRRIETTGKPIRTLTIYSPVSGYVVEKDVLQGMKADAGQKLFDVAGLSRVWILADIYETDLPLVRTGQMARISLSYFPGKEFSSRIDYVYPSLSGQTRTLEARFSLPNPGLALKPQMFSDIDIKIPLGSRLAVPESAVIDTGTRQLVYVDKGDGSFEPREVSTGVRTEDEVEIIKGLKAGERVATSATFLIDSEARLKGVVQ